MSLFLVRKRGAGLGCSGCSEVMPRRSSGKAPDKGASGWRRRGRRLQGRAQAPGSPGGKVPSPGHFLPVSAVPSVSLWSLEKAHAHGPCYQPWARLGQREWLGGGSGKSETGALPSDIHT